jgi:ABC-type multidrug transport system permease subunit
MRNAIFIAWQDLRFQLRQGSTLVWVFVMPPIFFYFIGTVTSGFSSTVSGATRTPIVVVAESPGFLKDQIDLRLTQNGFAAEWTEPPLPTGEQGAPRRTLTIDPSLSDKVLAGTQVNVDFETRANALSRELEIIRIQRSLYTALADIVVAEAGAGLSVESLIELNEKPRIWQLDVSSAGNRQIIPSGFEQSIPGILVMFTILVLLTSGGTMLVIERKQGLLRRLASTPISRTEVVAGKWLARMGLATLQVGAALVIGTVLFKMDWGPDLGTVILVLVAWAGFCASAGLWLGTIAKTEGQASGLGVLAANALAALGGCWWPIEVAPDWMQALQKFIPTGWTMDALHKLISFQSGASSVISNLVILLLATAIVGWLATRRFRYV